MRKIALVMVFCAAILSGPVASAQSEWSVTRTVDDFTDEVSVWVERWSDPITNSSLGQSENAASILNGSVRFAVACMPVREVHLGLISLRSSELFANGMVDIRFDDGPGMQYEFIDLDRELVLDGLDGERLIDRLMRGDGQIRIRVRRWPNEFVIGTIALAGLAEKMTEAGCP